MARRTKREARNERNSLKLAIVGAVVAAAVVVGAGIFMFKTAPDELDAKLCPVAGPSAQTILLVDTTDPLTFTQKQAFEVALRNLVEKQVAKGALLSVFVLGENFEQNAKPLVELCNPGDGSDKSEWTANLAKLKAQYQDAFIKPLLKESDALVASKASKYSPIFEMLQLVGINGFRKYGVKGDLKLVVMSDMLQNTPEYSMFKGQIDYATFAESSYGKRTQAFLPGVAVELQYLMDSPQLQTKRNLVFWEQYFEKAGAHIVRVQPMEG